MREWVEAPGAQYIPIDGPLELLPGLRLVPSPGQTRGSQVVVVQTGNRPVIVGGDMAVFFAELNEPRTEGQRLILALDPKEVWLSQRTWATHSILARSSVPSGAEGVPLWSWG